MPHLVCATSIPIVTKGRGLPPAVNRNSAHRSGRYFFIVWAPYLYVLNEPSPRQRKIFTHPKSATLTVHPIALLMGTVCSRGEAQ